MAKTLKEQVADLTAANKQLEGEKKLLIEDVETAGKTISKLEGMLAATLDENTAALADENAKLTITNATLTAQVEAAGGAIAKLEGEIKKLKEPVQQAAVNIKGFRLDLNDPFAAGGLRAYLNAGGKTGRQQPVLPFVLPFGDKAAKTALESYVVRAAGGGDDERADKARAAIAKCG